MIKWRSKNPGNSPFKTQSGVGLTYAPQFNVLLIKFRLLNCYLLFNYIKYHLMIIWVMTSVIWITIKIFLLAQISTYSMGCERGCRVSNKFDTEMFSKAMAVIAVL